MSSVPPKKHRIATSFPVYSPLSKPHSHTTLARVVPSLRSVHFRLVHAKTGTYKSRCGVRRSRPVGQHNVRLAECPQSVGYQRGQGAVRYGTGLSPVVLRRIVRTGIFRGGAGKGSRGGVNLSTRFLSRCCFSGSGSVEIFAWALVKEKRLLICVADNRDAHKLATVHCVPIQGAVH